MKVFIGVKEDNIEYYICKSHPLISTEINVKLIEDYFKIKKEWDRIQYELAEIKCKKDFP